MVKPKLRDSEYIQTISREYGLYTLDKRAIPAMTDGLKSGQRIALWTLRNRSEKIKTLAVVGQMIASELYVHGDTSAADAISMLAGPHCNNRPLIHGLGSFGTRAKPTSFAAPRYTSVKRSKVAMDCLYVDLDIIPLVENHDGSTWMPGTFLPLLPLVLLNGIKGTATGWATTILPRKFEDLVGAVDDILCGREMRELLPHYEHLSVVVVPMPEEQNKYTINGIVEKKNTTTVIVTELPPGLSLEKFRERLNTYEEQGKITSFIDRSTKTINVIIRMTRSILGKLSDSDLVEFLKLRTIITENITVQGINGSKIINYTSIELLVRDWVTWRLGLYLDRFKKLLSDEKKANLYWLYVLACFDQQLPMAMSEIKDKTELKTVIADCGKTNNLSIASEDILEKISVLPSYKWTQAGFDDAEKQLADSNKRMAYYSGMISSDLKRKNLFKKEVAAL